MSKAAGVFIDGESFPYAVTSATVSFERRPTVTFVMYADEVRFRE